MIVTGLLHVCSFSLTHTHLVKDDKEYPHPWCLQVRGHGAETVGTTIQGKVGLS